MSDALVKFARSSLLVGLCQVAAATAQEPKDVDFFGESVLRLETVSDGQVEDDGMGLTLLVRPAVELGLIENLTAIIEADFIVALLETWS